MKLKLSFLLVMLLSGILWAQDAGVICEVDYYNATRYVGGRNIARTANGNVVLVFEPGASYTDGNQNIHYVIYNPVFGTWDVAQLSDNADNASGTPAVVADPETENVYAVWKEPNSEGVREAMFAKLTFIDQFTHEWTDPVVADNIANNTGIITVDIADDGSIFNLFSIWDTGLNFSANFYASKSTDGGVTWNTSNLTSEFPTPDELPLSYLDVNLAPGTNGDMYAVWEDKPTEVTTEYEILMSKYTASEDSWSRPEIVSPTFDGDVAIHKYVDGCTPVNGAYSLYTMGPSGYVYEGETSVLYYDNGTSKTMFSMFNPYYLNPIGDRYNYIKDVVEFFGITENDTLLLVDDDNRYNNEWVMMDMLDSAQINYEYHDCGSVGGLPNNMPTAEQMASYDMVIWFCGSDGYNIAFWNAAEEDNPEIISYLETTGSKMWVLGEDVLYDRYGGAPDNFSSGDFCYDKLGIASYDVQAYVGDNYSGVQWLDLVTDNGAGFSSLEHIGWGSGTIRQGEPSIATDPSGKLHMVYKDENGNHIIYKNFDGTTWSDTVKLDLSADTIYVERPNIAVDENYGIYVTWVQATSDTTVGTSNWWVYNVFYATSPDGGVTWSEPAQLSNATYLNSSSYSVKNPTIGKKVRPAIEGVFDGGADVVWTQASNESSMGYYIMYARIPYVGTITGIDDNENVALHFDLLPGYPNPFNPSTSLKFEIDKTANVKLEIYNVMGQKVVTIVNEKMQAGTYERQWNASSSLPSGVYYARLQVENQAKVQKLVLMK